ncbi:MAG: hypothetical protein QOJ70_1142 [Acidobacteriota bacterium]|jgi:hypothetical protein|nr:hypothetical protein [Acidobacteriota bacterium]
MSIERRVEKIEQGLPSSASRVCICGFYESRAIHIRYPEDPQDESPVMCETCGREKELIIVQVISDRSQLEAA